MNIITDHTPTPAIPGEDTQKRRLVIVTDHAYLLDDEYLTWDQSDLWSLAHWAVMNSDDLHGADSVLFVPDEQLSYDDLVGDNPTFEPAWSEFSREWDLAYYGLDLDVAFYLNGADWSDVDVQMHGYGYTDGIPCRVNVFPADFNWCLSGIGRLKAALRHYTFDVSNFVGSDGKPNWAGLSSHVYDEIVVIDSRNEQPMAYAVELIEDVTMAQLLEEEEQRARQDQD